MNEIPKRFDEIRVFVTDGGYTAIRTPQHDKLESDHLAGISNDIRRYWSLISTGVSPESSE